MTYECVQVQAESAFDKKIEVVFVVVNLVCIFRSFYGFSLISTFIFLDFEFWNGPRSKSNHGRHGLNHG